MLFLVDIGKLLTYSQISQYIVPSRKDFDISFSFSQGLYFPSFFFFLEKHKRSAKIPYTIRKGGKIVQKGKEENIFPSFPKCKNLAWKWKLMPDNGEISCTWYCFFRVRDKFPKKYFHYDGSWSESGGIGRRILYSFVLKTFFEFLQKWTRNAYRDWKKEKKKRNYSLVKNEWSVDTNCQP